MQRTDSLGLVIALLLSGTLGTSNLALAEVRQQQPIPDGARFRVKADIELQTPQANPTPPATEVSVSTIFRRATGLHNSAGRPIWADYHLTCRFAATIPARANPVLPRGMVLQAEWVVQPDLGDVLNLYEVDPRSSMRLGLVARVAACAMGREMGNQYQRVEQPRLALLATDLQLLFGHRLEPIAPGRP